MWNRNCCFTKTFYINSYIIFNQFKKGNGNFKFQKHYCKGYLCNVQYPDFYWFFIFHWGCQFGQYVFHAKIIILDHPEKIYSTVTINKKFCVVFNVGKVKHFSLWFFYQVDSISWHFVSNINFIGHTIWSSDFFNLGQVVHMYKGDITYFN